MKNLILPCIFLFITALIASCSSIPDRPWSDTIPQDASFVIIPEEDASLNSVLNSSYSPFLDDITSSAVQLLSRIDSTATSPIELQGISLYPGTNDQLEVVWIAQTSNDFIDNISQTYYQSLSQNSYEFKDLVIQILHTGERNVYATQLNDFILLSESSLALEDAIRAYVGDLPRADLSGFSMDPGHIVMNTPSLDLWLQQLAQVTLRPQIKNSLQGTGTTLLSLHNEDGAEDEEASQYSFSGDIPLTDETRSTLVSSISSNNAPLYLDRFVSSNAAGFGFFRQEPRLAPPTSLADTSRLDSLFLQDNSRYGTIAQNFDQEFAVVMYAESGFLSSGEHLYLRKIKDASSLENQLNQLEDEEEIEKSDEIFYVQSGALAKLIGGDISGFNSFYLDIVDDVVIISKRKGLVELVASDRDRRRTMYYEQEFRDIKEELPEQVSSLFVTTPDFYSFVEPFLAPDNYVNALTSRFDLLAAHTTVNEQNESLSFNLKTYQTEDRSAPYRERWQFPTGSDITGAPVLSDIGGSSNDEIIFATEDGEVYGLASDGSVMFEAKTDGEKPVGSPVVYDWYGTNEQVILLAAENKVYGWNENGQPLPRFPFELDERITTGIVVEDIDRDGLPNALIATADRRLHALDGRGANISGWPVKTNDAIYSKPTVDNFQESLSVIAFSENAVHVWDTDGSSREDFPKFLNASLNGSPIVHEDHILGNASDGYLYSVGPEQAFDDTLNVLENTEEPSDAEAIYVSDSPLLGTPAIQTLTLVSEEKEYNDPLIVTMSANGSVFLLNTSGNLLFNENMGQPAAESFSPYITDINGNQNNELVGLGSFGRLYVWEIDSRERIYTMPTAGMKHPIVADINGDGNKELIAHTNNGLRSWTIYEPATSNN